MEHKLEEVFEHLGRQGKRALHTGQQHGAVGTVLNQLPYRKRRHVRDSCTKQLSSTHKRVADNAGLDGRDGGEGSEVVRATQQVCFLLAVFVYEHQPFFLPLLGKGYRIRRFQQLRIRQRLKHFQVRIIFDSGAHQPQRSTYHVVENVVDFFAAAFGIQVGQLRQIDERAALGLQLQFKLVCLFLYPCPRHVAKIFFPVLGGFRIDAPRCLQKVYQPVFKLGERIVSLPNFREGCHCFQRSVDLLIGGGQVDDFISQQLCCSFVSFGFRSFRLCKDGFVVFPNFGCPESNQGVMGQLHGLIDTAHLCTQLFNDDG